MECLAMQECPIWGNIVVCKSRGGDDAVIPMEAGDLSLVDRIVVSEVLGGRMANLQRTERV